ncbi:unnamed protein product [Parnassius apollo]|uniref:(apollo) hypothetical protein n=1 Tax=Parnassius apollo TaxID=110799 RepID=A0A8S3WC11_PARAO|nr:unnamed protein product [Parnassius apollo]
MSQLDDEDIENLLQQSDLEDIGDDEDDTWAPDAENDGLSDDSEDDMPLSSLPISRESDDGKWIKKKFRGRPTAVQQPPDPGEPPKSPAEYFENYFTEELFEQFSTATSQYYIAEKWCAMKPQCLPGEIKKFFGVHGMMSLVKCPRMKMYWHQKFKYDPIASAMSRDRFFFITS